VLTSSLNYQAALRSPHRLSVRVDAYDIDGVPRALDLRPTGGSVTANLTNRVTRSARFTMTRPDFPDDSDDALSPEFAVVQIRAGIRFGDDTEELFPVFTGRVATSTLRPDGQVEFVCDDLAADVLGFRFEQPRTTRYATTLDEIHALILDALPQAMFAGDTVVNQPTPSSLTWDEDRGQALDDLAESLGGRWFALGDGSFTVRPFDYAYGPIAQTFYDGDGGLLLEATVSRSREGVANSVTVVSERTDGSTPVRVPVRNTDPTSPTEFGGKFGRVSQIIKVQTPLTSGQATTLATTQLQAAGALVRQWSASVVPDYALEPGDTVALSFMAVADLQIIDQITYPLTTGESMTISGRAGTTGA